MNGLGFFAWQLETIRKKCDPVQLATMLSQAGVRWVSWKLANGIERYNQIGGNDKLLIDYMQALEAVGIVSGGWSYNYPEKPGTQSGIIAERIAKFSNNLAKFDHWMIDIEWEWKKPNLGKAIDTLLYLDVNKNFPVGFCSYRYPEWHSEVNYKRFLEHPTIKFNAPQVYWIGAHNPVEQTKLSKAQYDKITAKPFIPIGSAFGVGDWEPGIDELKAFVENCVAMRYPAYGWWSLDWVLKHEKWDWLEAIGGQSVTPPGPPPVVPPAGSKFVVTVDHCNPRTRPVIVDDTDAGSILRGKTFEKVGDKKDGFWPVKAWLHESVVEEV